jgi:predicted TIM-barrel fold metal-dependent hydrolase
LFAEVIDYHQHLYSPEAGARSSPGPKGISASDLIADLDAAGIHRAVVLSVAYSFSNPDKPSIPDEYAHVMAENDWTSAQVAKYPDRLLGFCSVNPLRPYALEEIARCAKDSNLRTGLKLHFGNSDVDVNNAEHLAQLRRVFHAANQNRMAIVVQMHSNVDHHRPYGAREARIFLEQLIPEAPDVTIQIAHLAGAGGYDDLTDQALSVFTGAIEKGDPRMKNVYFDACGIAIPGRWEDKADLIVKRIHQIGINRILDGSDAAVPGNLPKDALERFRQLPLKKDEFRIIENNIAPYAKDWLRARRAN